MPSKEDSTFFTNIITAGRATDGAYHPDSEPGTNWHTYEIVWKPNEVYWTYDGAVVRR